MQTAVIYARYSSSNQREESIEGQIRECRSFAKSQDITILKSYVDRALSAKTDHRPQFLQMIADSAKKQFKYIIVYTLDRFSRNRYDSAIYKNKLKKNGVKVLSAKENITDEPIGIVTEGLLESMAEYYSAELAQKINRGMTENALEGYWNGGSLPLGYKVMDKKLVIDECQAATVKLIYDLYVKDYGIMDIIHELNKRHLKTRKNADFNRSSITKILTNTKYIGHYKWHNIDIVCPAILDKYLFNSVQDTLKLNHRTCNRRKQSFPLTGKLYCGKCGGLLKSDAGTSKTGKQYQYYICRDKRRKKTCNFKAIRKDQLEKLVLNKTLEILDNTPIINELINQILLDQSKHHGNPVIDQLKAEVKTLRSKIEKLYAAMETTDTPPASLLARIKNYEQQLPHIEKDLAREKILDQPFLITEDHIRFFFDQLKKGKKNTDEYAEKIFNTFIRKIIVNEKSITIYYNYSPTSTISNKSSADLKLVETGRIELPTSCMPCKRSPS